MLRILSSRPYLFNSFIKKTRQLTVVFHPLSTESLPIQHDIDEDHQRSEISAPHYELLNVLNHHSSQLQSNRMKKIKPVELAKPNTSKRKKKVTKSDPIAELSEKLHIKSMSLPVEEEEAEVEQEQQSILPPSIEELTFNDDDKTLNNLLNSLQSKKVRRMHKYTDEQLKFMHKHTEFNRMLQAYVDVSINNGKLSKTRRFLEELLNDQERRQTMKHLTWRYVTNVHVYNSFYFAYADKGNLSAIQKLFEKMRKSQIKPTLESYAAVLNCLGNMDLFDSSIARRIILDLEKQGFRVVDIFNLDCLNHEQVQSILKVLKTFRPNFDIPLRTSNIDTKLLNDIYQQKPTIDPNNQTVDNWWTNMDFSKMLNQQLANENEEKVKVSSINYPDKIDPKLVQKHEDLMTNFQQQLSVGFLTELDILKKTTENKLELNIIPFLEIFDPKEYVDLMLKELTQHFYGSDHYSLPHNILCVMLGKRLYQKYLCSIRHKNGFIDKLRLIYDDYMQHIVTDQRFFVSGREKWNQIVHENFAYMDRSDRPWTYIQVFQIGEFLYDIMLKHLKLKTPLLVKSRKSIEETKRLTAKSTNAILYTVYRVPGNFTEKQIKVHPTVAQFFSLVPQKEIEFDCTELPCLVPPLPWLSSTSGGYLLKQTDFVRLPISAHEQDARLRSLPIEKTGGLYDSINVLNSCPWRINQPVLDLLIQIFQQGGNRKLSVPVSVDNANLKEVRPLEKGLTIDERKRREIAFAQVKKEKAEIFSLWCYELYRLSIANHFRNEIFWFPHNLDFRGRVYPIPPHFNHLGSDIARSIILFAEGKPLGDDGLRQLKIHLVNLTDLKKKCSIDEREQYADEIMDDILDSADRPLTGRQWWAQSEEPWQTLACCMEIARAIRSPDHTKYVCHFPVHQDGSCNVLQHYAAMGLDDVGAASVNLKPSDLPQDVYSVVVDQVEHERQQDAANGVEIARILQGFVKRKVIKQTIMTTNYGVTLYGARQQIGRQLKDIDEFPKDRVSEASSYLAQKTFLSLRELFRETRKIQDWFTDCAGLISRIRGSAVEWNTPLNLPVVQPYYNEIRLRQKGKDFYDNYSTFARPNHIKQKNAFPPNYVHSLDSTHMMMTALQCARNGITFVSVHDSFWTHACDVDRLSRFCRQQFVALHDEPLLEILSKDFQAKYEFKSSEFAHADENQKQTMNLLNDTLRAVPQRGTFQLRSVLDSTYFFS